MRGYAEGLLAKDKRPMRVGTFLPSQKLGRAPESFFLAGDCQFHSLLSLVCSQICRTLPNRPASAAILMFFVVSDDFIFDTRLMFLGCTRSKLWKNNKFGAYIFRVELRAPTLVTLPQRNANWRGKCAFRWGRQAKVNDRKSDVTFCMLFVGTRDNSDKGERFAGDVEQKLGVHARGRKVGHQ